MLVAAAPALAQAPAEQPVAIPNSASWTMTSAAGHRYRIHAAWPTAPAPAPAGGFPVLYVLDANAMFATAVETVRAYARSGRGNQAVVIGIGYPDDPRRARMRDMTYPSAGSDTLSRSGGGADAFVDFIERALKPEVARRFAVDPAREALFGHSLGGLFAGYALVKRPALFDQWIAASPSIWYGERWLLSDAAQRGFATASDALPRKPRVLLTVGAYEQAPDPDFVDPRAAELATLRQVDGARDFAAALSRTPGVAARFELIERENHGSVIPVAIARAVRFFFAPEKPVQ